MSVEYIKKLQKAHELFTKKHEFRVGDIVEWKPGMENRVSKGPFVVVEILPEIVMNTEESAGITYFREPLDIVLGQIDEEGDFIFFHYDSRRIQPFGG